MLMLKMMFENENIFRKHIDSKRVDVLPNKFSFCHPTIRKKDAINSDKKNLGHTYV